MPELVADCPRCGTARITFDVYADNLVLVRYKWQHWFEVFSVCRHCGGATTFVLSQKNTAKGVVNDRSLMHIKGALNHHMSVEQFVSIKDNNKEKPPEHLPAPIQSAFEEGATCMAVECHNAAGAMFRLCLDLATESMLPEEDAEGLNAKDRRRLNYSLGFRLEWMFDNNVLPKALKELSECIKDDGNDGAHDGTLNKEDAEDIQDFTYELLERLYTEPERLKLAEERRAARRGKQQ